ncbi:hypothetical protein SEA_ZETZY_34 [Mycobacterium phage Zetzy]|uniref:DUF2510 domain-containing protein n=1 Tax=Mycobacterium phage Zetzy TaxID=2499071 RepID=A0A3S9UNU0_9CAUD|nr:hypothetical protein KIJ59_gp56 [Mycobacterium phage Zetzy]AZS12004.1 hypothetical protein SEA_ZETZY_34 [Mycobacterium phage Zetzy]
MTQLQPAPGWYPDPSGAPGQRYFDGTEWTSHSQPPGHTPQPVAVLPKKTNHALHLLLTILSFPLAFFTFGIVWWLWVWIIVAISNHNKTQTIYR